MQTIYEAFESNYDKLSAKTLGSTPQTSMVWVSLIMTILQLVVPLIQQWLDSRKPATE